MYNRSWCALLGPGPDGAACVDFGAPVISERVIFQNRAPGIYIVDTGDCIAIMMVLTNQPIGDLIA